MHFIYSCHARHGRTEVGIRNVVGTQHAKGRTSMRSSALCLSHPRSSGAASTTGRLPYFQGRSESAMEACSMRCIASGARPPRFVIARRPKADVAISRHMPNNRKTISEIAAAFPRLHPKGTSSRFALRAPRPLRGLAMARQAGAAVHQRSSAVELSSTRRSLPVKGTPHP